MKHKAAWLAVVAGLTVALSVFAQDFAGRTVRDVRVEGLYRVSERLVRSQLEVQPGQTYSPPAIARDIRRLYDLGYFANIQVDASPVNDEIILTYIFREKQFVDEIRILGNDKVRDRHIRAVLKAKEGSAFTRRASSEEHEAILELYESKGFPNAAVDLVVEETRPSRVRLTYFITEGAKARIRSVRFQGNEALSDRKLRKTMKTKRAWWFIGGRYDEQKLEADLVNIIDKYGNHGYLEADIQETAFNYSPDGKRMEISITVDEGPQYYVETLDIVNNVVYDDDEIADIIEIAPGDVHDKSQVEKDADLIARGYVDSGYVGANVSAQVTLDRERKTTHIVHDVTERDLKYVREVKITGNASTKDEVLRRDLLQLPAERFDGAAVRASQRYLENTRYFEQIRLTFEEIEDDDRFINLLLDVDEGKTGTFSFGGGYSTEEKFGGFIELKRSNFDLMNWPSFSGAGQEFTARLSLGDVRTQYYVSFTDPEFMGYPLAFGVDFFDERYNYTGGANFTESTRGGRLRLAKSLSPYVSVRTSLRYVDTDISDLPYLTSPQLNRQRGGSTTVSWTSGITRNTLDIYRDPSRGAKHMLEVELAGLGGDNHFVKFEHDSTWYWPLTSNDKWILMFRTREGWATEYGSSDYVPIQDRFFAGGSSTVRGYDTRDIGPKERRYFFFGEMDAVGGNIRLINNLEVKYKLTDMLRLYAFVDAGGVWESEEAFDFGDMKYGAGIGIGVDIPRLGPVRIDYGIPINPDEDQGNGRLHLLTGFRF